MCLCYTCDIRLRWLICYRRWDNEQEITCSTADAACDWLADVSRPLGGSPGTDNELQQPASPFQHIMVGQTSMLQACIPGKTIDHMLTQMTTSKFELETPESVDFLLVNQRPSRCVASNDFSELFEYVVAIVLI